MTAIQPVEGPAEPKGDESDEERGKEEAYAFEHVLERDVPRIYVTPALIAINVFVYALMCLKGVDYLRPDGVSLLIWGANYGPLTSIQWWRVVTSTFVHAGLLHIALNMWALWASARIVERLYGAKWFLVLYMACGVGASLVSLWQHPGVPSVGASGAIVGVYGCLLAFMLHPNEVLSTAARNTEVKSLLAFFGYLLVAGIRDSAIDTPAHIGGAVIGFIIGSMYATWIDPRLPVIAAVLAPARAYAHVQGSAVISERSSDTQRG
jgi:rhomboid protease GluP